MQQFLSFITIKINQRKKVIRKSKLVNDFKTIY